MSNIYTCANTTTNTGRLCYTNNGGSSAFEHNMICAGRILDGVLSF